MPDLIMDRVREKVRVGLKATSKFVIQMSIQSLFDQRSVLAKLVQIFNNDGQHLPSSAKYDYPTMAKVFTSCHMNNFLRQFQFATEHLGSPGELAFPNSGLFI